MTHVLFMKFCRFFDSVRTTDVYQECECSTPFKSQTLIHYASCPAGLPKVNDIIRSKEKKTARKDERRDVYSAVTARAIEEGYQHWNFEG